MADRKSQLMQMGCSPPRNLFNDNLPFLIKELTTINNVVRTFSEIALGEIEEIEVRSISTSNPIFFFSIDPVKIAMIAGAVTWALDVWERVERTRKLRTETAKLDDTESRADVEKLLSQMIEESIEKAIKNYSAQLLEEMKAEGARKNEISNQLDWALRSILSRIERGMVIEIRRLPPPVEKDEQGTAQPVPQSFQDIDRAIQKLVFPPVQGTPVLSLPPSDLPESDNTKRAK